MVTDVCRKWVLGSNIPIRLYVLDMWSVFCVPCVANIAVGLCVMDMWSELCVPYLGGGIEYSSRTVCNGRVVRAVCSVYGWWGLIYQ